MVTMTTYIWSNTCFNRLISFKDIIMGPFSAKPLKVLNSVYNYIW